MVLKKNGITRLVILTKKYAIKFPRFDYGWRLFIEGIRANLNEREFWKIANIPDNELTKALSHICPILWCSWGAWLLIMPRVEPLSELDLPEQDGLYQTREAFLVLERLVGDHKDDNYGIYNGRVVMFDYGCTNIDYFENQKEIIYK